MNETWILNTINVEQALTKRAKITTIYEEHWKKKRFASQRQPHYRRPRLVSPVPIPCLFDAFAISAKRFVALRKQNNN